MIGTAALDFSPVFSENAGMQNNPCHVKPLQLSASHPRHQHARVLPLDCSPDLLHARLCLRPVARHGGRAFTVCRPGWRADVLSLCRLHSPHPLIVGGCQSLRQPSVVPPAPCRPSSTFRACSLSSSCSSARAPTCARSTLRCWIGTGQGTCGRRAGDGAGCQRRWFGERGLGTRARGGPRLRAFTRFGPSCTNAEWWKCVWPGSGC